MSDIPSRTETMALQQTVPSLLDPSKWNKIALELQQLLVVDDDGPVCKEHIVSLLTNILESGSLTKFKKGAVPIDTPDAKFHEPLGAFSTTVHINVCEVRHILRSQLRTNDDLKIFANLCKKAHAIANNSKLRALGSVDSLAACFVLVLALTWFNELRNDNMMWNHVATIYRTNFSDSDDTQHSEVQRTHAIMLTALWIYGSDCRVSKLTLSKNYLLNALSLLFRTDSASFKVGGKCSSAMKGIDVYLDVIADKYRKGFISTNSMLLENDYGVSGFIDINAIDSAFEKDENIGARSYMFSDALDIHDECGAVCAILSPIVLPVTFPVDVVDSEMMHCWPVDDSPRDRCKSKKRKSRSVDCDFSIAKIKKEETDFDEFETDEYVIGRLDDTFSISV